MVIMLIFSNTVPAQSTKPAKDSAIYGPLNPLLVAAYKKPAGLMSWHQPALSFKKYIASRGGELMHWPSYPLTTGQIIARNEEWQKRNNPNIGEQIASDIIRSNVNRLIYGRKPVPAVIPKF